jgi:hypothetical protein
MKTLTLAEAGQFLKMHPEEVRRRVKVGTLPGAKAGRAWVFIEEDLANYLRSLYASNRQALRVTPRKESQLCHSENVVTRGGSISPHLSASALDVLLAQAVKPKPKSCTTNSKRNPGECNNSVKSPSTPGTMPVING